MPIALHLLKKKLHVQSLLSIQGTKVITIDAFLSFCTHGSRIPQEFRMTCSEANTYLQILLKNGQAVRIGKDLLHLEPEEIINAVHLKAGLPLLSQDAPFIAIPRDRSTALAYQREHAVSEKLHNMLIHQKNFWALMALFSGIQMAFLAYLTFVVYDWDVMEPVCYFVTAGTALCIFAYFLYFKRECSCGNLDKKIKGYLLEAHLKSSQSGLQEWFHHAQISNRLNAISSSTTTNSSKIIAKHVKQRK
ncbi:unnamed protein product [Phytomonas sp. EM1]|nr:unnamed protein product [Phytomonas sp. EM1]|eukprot:CCW62912.1 unnamed protein product [Phytomonas sp. isolate EM1]